MRHIMFDVDGTLLDSYGFDEECFITAVKEVTGKLIDSNWSSYPHVTDTGILQTFIERQAPELSLGFLENAVKSEFLRQLKRHLKSEPAREIFGANQFFTKLLGSHNHLVSIATGGWRESALLKLESAGFDIGGANISSSNDHYSRIEIMKHSRSSVVGKQPIPLTYFGDAQWDVTACAELGANLVIIGNRVSHTQTAADYKDHSKLLKYIESTS